MRLYLRSYPNGQTKAEKKPRRYVYISEKAGTTPAGSQTGTMYRAPRQTKSRSSPRRAGLTPLEGAEFGMTRDGQRLKPALPKADLLRGTRTAASGLQRFHSLLLKRYLTLKGSVDNNMVDEAQTIGSSQTYRIAALNA